MDWTPETNRVPTCLLTADELAAMKAAKHGWEFWNTTEQDWSNPLSDWDGTYFYPQSIYRAKPAPAPTLSITVNGVTNVVAAPVTEKPEDGDDYFCPAPCFNDYVLSSHWISDQVDYARLNRGLIHLSETAARAHAMAMVGLKAEVV